MASGAFAASRSARADPRRGGHGPDASPLPDCPPGGRTRILTPPAPVRAANAHAEQRGSAEPVEG